MQYVESLIFVQIHPFFDILISNLYYNDKKIIYIIIILWSDKNLFKLN